ncbi:MAG TPA: hypothetical protein VGF82_00925 [Terracidiphilus sp.]|jgi:hypothetical protein
MPRKFLFLLAVASLGCLCAAAQDKEARDRLSAAHAQYYTPTASGLKSFRCDASIDWKAMLSRFSGTDVPDDAPVLKLLQTVHLAVTDDLRGKGSLEWTTGGDVPEDKKAGFQQMQEGLQTAVSGFFQSWNAYVNGSMVPLPDNSVTLTKAGEGIHVSAAANGMNIDEDFDKNMLLTQALVVSPTLKVLATPTFAPTPDGLVVSSVMSQVHQPPDAPETDATFRIDYTKVESYQIPSHVVFDIKNTGVIEIGFSACKVTVADWAKKQ